MQYRTCKASGNNLSSLGFGFMRFPQIGGEAERMVLAAIEGGVNFFDTAYIYPNSEKTLGGILHKHGLREKVYISTKMPISMTKTHADFDKFFNQQLARLKTDYIDYYLIHNISNFAQWEMTLALGIETWLAKKKAAGQIKHVGFSYHGSGEEFPQVLNSYPWEFCMLQYNYYDENYQAGKKGVMLAAEKGLTVLIMEPLLGGRLATGLPKKAAEIFEKSGKSPAEQAFRWLYNHDEVTVVLSGMTSEAQAGENMRYASDFTPPDAGELSMFARVVEIFHESFKVKCTGCNYCLPCPKAIDIPARLAAYNASYAQNYFTGMVMYLTGMGVMSRNPISVHLCNNCGKCEKDCPQHIPIRKELKKVASRFEPLPMRVLLKFLRFVMR